MESVAAQWRCGRPVWRRHKWAGLGREGWRPALGSKGSNKDNEDADEMEANGDDVEGKSRARRGIEVKGKNMVWFDDVAATG